MEKLKTFDEYTNLIKEVKSACKKPFSNIYYMSRDIKNYIGTGRLSYEKVSGGVLFFLDEELYYRVWLYIDEKAKFIICPQDKKMLVRNIYKSGEKEESLQCIDHRLEESGFQKEGTTIGIQGELQNLLQKCEKIKKYAEAMERKGFRCVEADFSMYGELEAIILDSGIVKDYQLDYRTEEEKRKLEKGSYLYIADADGQICAASICIVENGIANGVALAVKEEYKRQGIAPYLTYHRFQWMRNKEVRIVQGWILTSNVPSLKYHQSMGHKFLDRYADEWVLDLTD